MISVPPRFTPGVSGYGRQGSPRSLYEGFPPDREMRAVKDERGKRRPGTLVWILAAALTMGSSAPVIAAQVDAPGTGPLTPTKHPPPTPTPSPEPSPTPTPSVSPEPSPTPTQTPEPSPDPTPGPSPTSTPAGPTPTPSPPSSVDGGSFGPTQSPGSLDLQQSLGLEDRSGTERPQEHAGGAVDRTGSFIESVTSILDQLVSVDAPIAGSQLPCRTVVCGSPLGDARFKAMALASICILLALAAVFGVVARRRRSSRDPRLTPS